MVIILSATSITAQRSCGTQILCDSLCASPLYQKAHQQKQQKYTKLYSRQQLHRDYLMIPVAFHFQDARLTESHRSYLEGLCNMQVEVLNDDFGGHGYNVGNWDDGLDELFPNTQKGESNISFHPAKKMHPQGYDIQDGQMAVTINKVVGDNAADWKNYLNIFILSLIHI